MITIVIQNILIENRTFTYRYANYARNTNVFMSGPQFQKKSYCFQMLRLKIDMTKDDLIYALKTVQKVRKFKLADKTIGWNKCLRRFFI